MADIFISYARADEVRVERLVAALQAKGWNVWWDTAVSPGEEFDDVIAAALERAKAVLVVWTPASVASRWVRGEARVGADRGILVPARFDGALLAACYGHLGDNDAARAAIASYRSLSSRDLRERVTLFRRPEHRKAYLDGIDLARPGD